MVDRRRRPWSSGSHTRRRGRDDVGALLAAGGWVYLHAPVDCCTREITAWTLDTRIRAAEAIGCVESGLLARAVPPGTLTLGVITVGRRPGVVGDERALAPARAARPPPLAVPVAERD